MKQFKKFLHYFIIGSLPVLCFLLVWFILLVNDVLRLAGEIELKAEALKERVETLESAL